MGRPRNDEAYRSLLERISRGVFECDLRKRGTLDAFSWTPLQLRHYLRELKRRGLVSWGPVNSDTLRGRWLMLTPEGVIEANRGRAEGVAETPPPVAETVAETLGGTEKPSKQTTLAEVPALLPPARAEYLGVHQLTYRLEIQQLGSLEEKFVWEGERALRNWTQRYARVGVDVEAFLNGRPPKSITLRLSSRASQPYEGELHALQFALAFREQVEDAHGCRLRNPVVVSHQKHTIIGDPVAESIRRQGLTLHEKGAGIDNTPLPGTLHLETSEAVSAYLHMAENVLAIRGASPELTANSRATLEVLKEVRASLGRIADVLEGRTQERPKAPPDSKEGFG